MQYIKYIGGVIAVAVMGFFGYYYYKYQNVDIANAEIKKQAVDVAAEQTGSSYKDGAYSSEGSYQSPSGQEKLSIDIILANNIITSVKFTGLATDRTSKMWQDKFASGLNTAIVGKKISDVNLDNVNGSSLTPIGFNVALAKIKSQAKS